MNTILEPRMDSAFFSKERIEQRKRWRIVNREWSYFEAKWKPKSWDTSYCFIFVRKKARKQHKGPLQLHFFEPRDFDFDYKVIVTNKTESIKAIVQFHNCIAGKNLVEGDGWPEVGQGKMGLKWVGRLSGKLRNPRCRRVLAS